MDDNKVAQALDRLGQRLGRIEERLNVLDGHLGTAQGAIGALVDSFDDMADNAAEGGASLYDRSQDASTLVERVTRPGVLRALTALVERVESMEEAAKLSDQIPGMAAAIIDSVDDMAMRAIDAGVDLPLASRRLGDMLQFALWSLQSKEFSRLFNLDSLRDVASAWSATSEERTYKRKVISLWKASRDPDIRRTLDFGFRFARRLGEIMNQPPNENTLTESN